MKRIAEALVLTFVLTAAQYPTPEMKIDTFKYIQPNKKATTDCVMSDREWFCKINGIGCKAPKRPRKKMRTLIEAFMGRFK